ncbi:MAG: sugar transferase [bacterium]
MKNQTFINMIKRFFDTILSFIALLLLSPIFLLISKLIIITMGFPVWFKQTRPGLQGKPFVLYKFRTMNNKRDQKGNLLPDEERLTGFGRFLRSASLDELPELFNVLKGDMSLVGPRPLLMQYLDRYSPEQARRHEVKPGITGWAQVNGRNAVSWEERFKMDVWYVDHVSFWLDVKILFLTLVKVFRREGINQPGHATVEYFQGNTNVEES